jgi:hypothetical protein
MYLPTSLGQALGSADCSRWETDPQSFSKSSPNTMSAPC